MLVKMQTNRLRVTGLHIGHGNVRKFIPAEVRAIDLELDDLRIQCMLDSEFWGEKPLISDARLCAWLEAKQRSDPSREFLSMTPSGQHCYRLQVVRFVEGVHPPELVGLDAEHLRELVDKKERLEIAV